jgi:FAD/FMN-containing dehydrogenase
MRRAEPKPAGASGAGAPSVRVRLLGGFEVVVDGRAVPGSAWRLRKASELVRILSLAPGHRVHREALMEQLWPDRPLEAAANNLHQAIRVARAALGPRACGSSPQAGVTWRELDHETQAFGLAVTGGLISSTGIAGFTLGGGIGWLMRKYGLTCDNLVAADVVTADGRLVRASEHENPELFWGLRGGGGNFGTVTSFEFTLHRVGPTILAGPIFFPGDQAEQILRGFRAYTQDLPDEMTTLVNLTTAPPVPFLPEDVHGKKVVAVVGVYAGSPDAGRELAAGLRGLGTPIADLLGPMPYTTLQSLLDPLWAPGARNYFKAGFVGALSDDSIAAIVEAHGPAISPSSEIHIHHMGGAVARVADDATAFGERGAPYLLNIVARWTDPATDAAQIAWAKDLLAAVEPDTTGGTYVNFLSAGDDRVAAAYGSAKVERLARLKETWDPTNLFRLNQNIRPAGLVRS